MRLSKKMSVGMVVGSVINKSLEKTKGKAKSGKAGSLFESTVFTLSECFSFDVCKQSSKLIRPIKSNKIELDVPYKSMSYQVAERKGIKTKKCRTRTEFVLSAYNINRTKEFPNVTPGKENRIRVECKYQNSSGTTEQKLMQSYMDLKEGAPEDYVILLVDGKGFTDRHIALIREICQEDTISWTKSTRKIELPLLQEERIPNSSRLL